MKPEKPKKRRNVGIHSYRLKRDQNNPREVAFADQWELENQQGDIMMRLMGNGARNTQPTPEQVTTAATVVQWLGSNVGTSFIREVIKRNPKAFERYLP